MAIDQTSGNRPNPITEAQKVEPKDEEASK